MVSWRHPNSQPRSRPGDGIGGVRMPAEIIADLKAEARELKTTFGKLIQELWTDYRSNRKTGRTR